MQQAIKTVHGTRRSPSQF